MATGGEGEDMAGVKKEGAGITEEDRKLLEAFHELKMDPQIEGAEDLAKFLRRYNERKEESERDRKPNVQNLGGNVTDAGNMADPVKDKKPQVQNVGGNVGQTGGDRNIGQTYKIGGQLYQFPKLPCFFGEENKGECNWDVFKHEVESAMSDGVFSEEQVMLGVRRALKGTAAEMVRNLGTHITVREAVKKLDSAYGNIESRGSASKKFYTCAQGEDSVNTYCIRLEKYYAKCLEVGAIARGDEDILKQTMYEGLHPDLQVNAQYKYETIIEYDDFKVELRKLESTMKQRKTREQPAAQPAPQVQAAQRVDKDKEEKTEMNEFRDMLKQINEKIEQLQRKKEPGDGSGQSTSSYFSRGFRQGRGLRYRGRGRGDYRPRRPLASTTFQGSCYHCNERGHMARYCPKLSTGNLKE